jgi:hypothetical protein
MIVKNSRVARIFKVSGIVLYPFIFLAPKNPDSYLLNHEMIHWDQIRRHGVLIFYFQYVREYLSLRKSGLGHNQAYRSISFEQEAYQFQNDLTYLEKRKLV